MTALLALGGCRATILKPTEADESRRQVQELTRTVERLEAENAGLHAELGVLRRGADADPLAVVAVPVTLELARFSGPARTADDSRTSLIRLYLRPLDRHGRFAHPLGALTVEVLAWPADGTPRVAGALVLSAQELVSHHRSGPLGTHYTVEVPLDPPLDLGGVGPSLLLRCRLDDDLSGRVTTLEQRLSNDSARSRRVGGGDHSAPSSQR